MVSVGGTHLFITTCTCMLASGELKFNIAICTYVSNRVLDITVNVRITVILVVIYT